MSRERVQIDFSDSPSLVHPEFKAHCDIRTIMNQYRRRGVQLPSHLYTDEVLDLSNVPDYHESMNIVVRAQDALDALPATLRKRFGNDPAQFLAYVNDESNRDEMVKLGMIKPIIDQEPQQEPQPQVEADPTST